MYQTFFTYIELYMTMINLSIINILKTKDRDNNISLINQMGCLHNIIIFDYYLTKIFNRIILIE